MKTTGIVRKIDHLGRIVIPVEIRRVLNIAEDDPVEIGLDGDTVTVRKYTANADIESVLGMAESYIRDDDSITDAVGELMLAKVAEIKVILKENMQG